MNFEEFVIQNRQEFVSKVRDICDKLNIDPEWLMFVMYFESAHTFRPDKVNSISGATGLIQFMPSTARALGTTTNALKKMTNIEQLDFVYQYLKPYRGKMNSWIDVYLAVFYPKAMNQGDNFIIKTDIVAKQNPGFDLNKDLDITVTEIKTALRKHMPFKYKNSYK